MLAMEYPLKYERLHDNVIMPRKKSQDATERTRVFATVVYPDSAVPDWRDRLTDEHVAALLSPLHDKDENPDGTKKKEHYHLMIMFDGVKSREQVDKMLDRVLGDKRIQHYENVNSTRGYARYLCHMDNPEKAQYSQDDVVTYGGVDYDDLIQLGSDDRSTLVMVYAYIREHKIHYYHELIDACIDNNLRSMFALITEKRTLAVTQYLRAMCDADKARQKARYQYYENYEDMTEETENEKSDRED